MIIGIYGKTGSGKTETANYLKKNHYFILNMDYIAKIVLKEKENEIIKKLPFLNKNNKIDYIKLKLIIFNSISKGLLFNYTISPYITQFLSIIKKSKNIFVLEGAIINFLNIEFDYLFYIDTIINNNIKRKSKIIDKKNLINLLNVQKYYIKSDKSTIILINNFFFHKRKNYKKITLIISKRGLIKNEKNNSIV